MLQPTCSAYAANAFDEHGYVLGFILMSDRLMHEGDKADYLKISQSQPWLHDWNIGPRRNDWLAAMWFYNFRPHFKDKVSDNTAWWK